MRLTTVFLLSLAVVACSAAINNNPGSSSTYFAADGSGDSYAIGVTPSTSGTDKHCQLDTLILDGGFIISPTFDHHAYQYTADLNDWSGWTDSSTTRVFFHLEDDGSSVYIKLNGVWLHSRALGNQLGQGLASNPFGLIVGTNVLEVSVSCNGEGMDEQGNPVPCFYTYVITIVRPSPGGQVVGDPQFVGLLGQQYQVHGVSGEYYNIVSDVDFSYSAKFVFLEQGKCPTIAGRRARNCWTHPGSYLGEIGLMTKEGDKIHLVSGEAEQGFASIVFNGRTLQSGDEVTLLSGGSLNVINTHQVLVRTGRYEVTLENSDLFVNQNFKVKTFNGMDAHGLLGQTHRAKTYSGKIKQIQGEVDDYVLQEKSIFGTQFTFNKFKTQ